MWSVLWRVARYPMLCQCPTDHALYDLTQLCLFYTCTSFMIHPVYTHTFLVIRILLQNVDGTLVLSDVIFVNFRETWSKRTQNHFSKLSKSPVAMTQITILWWSCDLSWLNKVWAILEPDEWHTRRWAKQMRSWDWPNWYMTSLPNGFLIVSTEWDEAINSEIILYMRFQTTSKCTNI